MLTHLRKPQLISFAIVIFFLATVSIGNYQEHKKLEQVRQCNVLKAQKVAENFAPLLSVVKAKAFTIYNFTSEASLYGNNENLALPLASLTKLMTTRVVLKNKTGSKTYTVQKNDLDSDGPIGFVVGDTYTVSDLITAALVPSSNNAAVMLAKSTGLSVDGFTAAMNAEAQNLGLDSLSFKSVTGLDSEDNKATVYGSARDVAILLNRDATDFPETLKVTTLQKTKIYSTTGRGFEFSNTDAAIPKLPILVASKTGYTDIAGGNLAVLWQEHDGSRIGAVVLGSTQEGRFADMIAIHDATGRFLESQKTLPAVCLNL